MSEPREARGVTATDATLPMGEAAASERTVESGPGPAGESAGPGALPIVEPRVYEILGVHGRGGLGRILRARDRRTGRVVAIKEMLPGAPDAAARFAREALVTANLQHPAIVPVYEVGRWPSGEPFYAMKLVAGRSLAEAVAGAGGLDGRLALLPHVIAIADALACAHEQGVIHRDLKPANVLVGAFGETVVIDWGLAKRLRDPEGGAAEAPSAPPAPAPGGGATVAGAILGTPAYMPPEQARGEPVDERADVYALGAILHHLLAGAPPFAGPSAEAVVTAVRAGPPAPPRAREPGVPPDLAAIAAKAMARVPADRYPSARELADDLRRFQTGRLVAAHRYSRWALLGRFVRRHRAALTVAAVAAALLAASGVVSVRRVVEERDRARAEAARATRATRAAISAWLRAVLLKDAKRCYEEQLATQATLAGTVRVRFDIERDGRLAGFSAPGLGDGMEACLADRAQRLRFPDPAGIGVVTPGERAHVEYPFTFGPAPP